MNHPLAMNFTAISPPIVSVIPTTVRNNTHAHYKSQHIPSQTGKKHDRNSSTRTTPKLEIKQKTKSNSSTSVNKARDNSTKRSFLFLLIKLW